MATPIAPDVGLDLRQAVSGASPSDVIEGLDLLPAATYGAPLTEQPGPFKRGLKSGTAAVKASLYGAGALAAHGIGAVLPASVAPVAQGVEQAALANAAEQNAAASEGAVRFEDVVADPSRAGEYAKWALGSAVPSLATMAVGGGVGAGIGAIAGRKTAATLAARALGVTSPAVKAGALAGAVVPDVAIEAGSIYPEALETGVENPALRALAGGAAAGAVDFLTLPVAVRALLPAKAALTRKAGLTAALGATAKTAATRGITAGGAEAAQELSQSFIERLAAGLPLTDAAAVSDYINSAAVGGIAGVGLGGAAGGFHGVRTPVERPAPAITPAAPTATPTEPAAPPTPEQVQADLTTRHAAATASLATLEPAVAQAQQEHDALVAKREALNAESKLEPGQRRTKSEITKEKRALAEQVKKAKAKIEDVGGQLFAARTAVADLATQIGSQASELQGISAATEQVPASPLPESGAPSEVIQPSQQPVAGAAVPEGVPSLATSEASLATPPAVFEKPFSEMSYDELETALDTARQRNDALDIAAVEKHKGATFAAEFAKWNRRKRDAWMRDNETEEMQNDSSTMQGVDEEAIRGYQQAVNDFDTESPAALGKSIALKTKDMDSPSYIGSPDFVTVRNALLYAAKQGWDQADVLAGMRARAVQWAGADAPELFSRMFASAAPAPTPEQVQARAVEGARIAAGALPNETQTGGVTTTMTKAERFIAAAKGINFEDTKTLAASTPPIPITNVSALPATNIHDYIVEELAKKKGTPEKKIKLAASIDSAIADITAAVATIAPELRPGTIAAMVKTKIGGKVSADVQSELVTHITNVVSGTQQSRAALTQDEFEALPPEAQAAAADAYSAVMRQKGMALRTRLTQLIGDRPELKVMTFAAEHGGAIGSYTRVGPLKAAISMAVNAKEGLSVADHEGYHFAEDALLSTAEKRIVANAMKPGKPLYEVLKKRLQQYDAENQTSLTDEVTAIPAEARAYGFEFWRRGELKVEAPLARVWQKLKQFFERVANAVRGLGFQSIEDVFTALDQGQMAERELAGGEGGAFSSIAGGRPWYRSMLTESVAAIQSKQASAQGWKDQIKGLVSNGKVKQAEIEATGLNDWLDLQQGKVTKDQVMAFLGENGVQVRDVTLGGKPDVEILRERFAQQEFNSEYGALNQRERDRVERQLEVALMNNGREGLNGPKFAIYQLPGGENYKELLLTLPERKTETGLPDGWRVYQDGGNGWRVESETGETMSQWQPTREAAIELATKSGHAAKKSDGAIGNFTSSHFDQPNILAHVRFNERTDAEGKRVLFLEELQSDWAQKGRKEGFGLTTSEQAELAALKKVPSDQATADQKARFFALSAKEPGDVAHVPSAPFVGKTEAWTALALKRMIRYAAENGFDRVAWTTGEQQVNTYRQALRNVVDTIQWRKTIDGVHIIGLKDGHETVNTIERENAVSDAIGKTMADRIRNDPNQSGEIKGAGITIDDIGMSQFYGDQSGRKGDGSPAIVTNVANDVLRKLGGGKVGGIDIPIGPEVGAPTIYEGPVKQASELSAIMDTAARDWPVSNRRQLQDVMAQMDNGKTFAEAMGIEASPALAEKLGGSLHEPGPAVIVQPGFDITDKLAENAANGLPLFSRAAATIDVRMRNGELETSQQFNAVADLVQSSRMHTNDDLLRTAIGPAFDGMAGGIKRWWMRYISTPNYIAAFSKGYKNVMHTLNSYIRYRETLIERMLREQMPQWYTASFADQDVTFAALLDRTVNMYEEGSPQYQELMRKLTPEQQVLFNSATKMVAGFLDAELEVDAAAYKEYLKTPGAYEKWLTDRTAAVADLKKHGYIPLRRYGDFTVRIYKDIVDAEGKTQKLTVHLEMFQTEAKMLEAQKLYQAEFDRAQAPYQIEVGTKHKTVRDTTISVQQYLDTARRNGVEISATERERLVLALTASESQIRNRLLHRENVPGFSRDGLRVLNEFGVNMSGKIAYAKFASAIDAAADGRAVTSDVVNGQPQIEIDYRKRLEDGTYEPVADYKARSLWTDADPMTGYYRNLSDELSDYVLVPDNTGTWSTKLRGAAMMYFIGGSISGAMVNAMSVPMILVPQLSIHTNYANGMAEAMGAWRTTWANQSVLRDITKLKDKLNYPIPEIDNVPGLREALISGADKLMDTELHQIMAISQGSFFSQSRTVQKAMETWMAPFRISEQTNRITSFIAAYKVGKANGLKEQALFNFARDMVDATQNNYSAANRPGAARHPVYAMAFMFKSFPLFMTEAIHLMYKANPKSAVFMLLGLVMLTGVQGLPFAETLLNLIDTISQGLFGSPFNARRAMRNTIKGASEAIVGYDLSDIVLRGVMNEITGMSIASRIGAGDFVPGTRLGTADADQGRILSEFVGAPYSMVKDVASNAGKLVGGVFTGDWKQTADALRGGGPIAARNVIKGIEQFQDGYASDSRGRKVVDVSSIAAFWQLLGVSSAGMAKMYDMETINIQTKAFYTQVSQDMQEQLANAIRANDVEKVQEINTLRNKWNEQYPEMPIMPNAASLRRSMMLAGLPMDKRSVMLWSRRIRGANMFSEQSGEE